jgi:cytochrome b subunit of formate dehydrogenase
MNHTRIIRHKLVDRLFHWFFAISILVLLFSGLLPVFGFNASLIVIHWLTGIVLTVLLLIHIVRSVFWKKLSRMWFSRTDIDLKRNRSGKYSLAQKLMHQFISLLTVAGIITGIVMMIRIDTPLFERDPYWLNAETWGLVYFIHGLVALLFVSTLMLHIYFSLRPESRMYLRSMFKGWITKEEYSQKHDAELWPLQEDQDKG